MRGKKEEGGKEIKEERREGKTEIGEDCLCHKGKNPEVGSKKNKFILEFNFRSQHRFLKHGLMSLELVCIFLLKTSL